MTTILLIRHGSTRAVGDRLVGRLPGIHLDEVGSAQALRLARHLGEQPIAAVCSSPMERARETAGPIARARGLEVQVRPAFNEIDFGDWTGRSFDELASIPAWQNYNTFRSGTRIPDGEHFAEVQGRVVAAIDEIRTAHPSGIVAVVSHADVIRTALAYYAAIPFDLFLRIAIDPGSVSTIQLGPWGVKILGVNAS